MADPLLHHVDLGVAQPVQLQPIEEAERLQPELFRVGMPGVGKLGEGLKGIIPKQPEKKK